MKDLDVSLKILRRQIGLIDRLSAAHHNVAEGYKPAEMFDMGRGTAKKRMHDLDGLAEFLSALAREVTKDGSVIVMRGED